MPPRKAASFVLVFSLLAGLLPASVSGETYDQLAVSGDGWQFVKPLENTTFSRDLFQAPGDLDGDGYDDLILRVSDQGGYAFAHGGGSGLGAGTAPTAGFCIPVFPGCGPSGDAGAPTGFDTRPMNVDTDGDGGADFLSLASSDFLAARLFVNYGTSGSALSLGKAGEGNPPPLAYLIGPVRAGDTAAVILETPGDRSGNGTEPSRTQFQVVFLGKGTLLESTEPWNVSEPLPLAPFLRRPHFLDAPDFDGDGLADVVTVTPPAFVENLSRPGAVTIYNGSSDIEGPHASMEFSFDAGQVLLGDFDGDGHKDIATFHLVPPSPGTAGGPTLGLEFRYWNPGGFGRPSESTTLSGPSIFLSQPPPRVQAADVDRDGYDDLVVAKYDTTSATSGHVLVDVFLHLSLCKKFSILVCDADLHSAVSYSTEINISGSDVYSGDGGLRLNVQSDFDADGRSDVTIGFIGGNAPDRGRTSVSAFVAVLAGKVVSDAAYGLSLDTDPGGFVYPLKRAYRLTLTEPVPAAGTLRFEFTNTTTSVFFDIDIATENVSSPYNGSTPFQGEITTYWRAFNCQPCGEFVVSVSFWWNFTDTVGFGGRVTLTPDGGGPDEVLADNPHLADFERRVRFDGDLEREWRGQTLSPEGWVAGGALVNISGLHLVFVGPSYVEVPRQALSWAIVDENGDVVIQSPGDPLATSVVAPNSTVRGAGFRVEIRQLPEYVAAPTDEFTINVDADPPEFGSHLPLESEWVTNAPAFVAVQVLDYASGPDLSRIEISWENDGAPFVRWDRATALPSQTPGEVVGQAFINFPEGNLSNLIWRAWDAVGNGPSVSPIFGVKVDTQDLVFYDPHPTDDEWVNDQNTTPQIWIRGGSSGINSSTVEFRTSTGGLFGFGAWQHTCIVPPPTPPGSLTKKCGILVKTLPNGSIDPSWGKGFSADFPFAEGDANWIQWRAENNAGTGLRYSDPFQMKFDSKISVIASLLPSPSTVLPLQWPLLSIEAHEGSPQSVAQRGLDTSAGAATYRVRGPLDVSFGAETALDLVFAAADGWNASFAATLALERGNSTIEVSVREIGGRAVTAQTVVRVNQLPTLEVESNPANFIVEVNGTITLTARALDPEGMALAYAWAPCPGSVGRPPFQPPPFSHNATFVISPDSPETIRTTSVRDVVVCVTVRDPIDGLVMERVTVQVVAAVPPPPPPPPAPTIISSTGDAPFAALLLLVAAATAAVLLFLRRRRAPPDNV